MPSRLHPICVVSSSFLKTITFFDCYIDSGTIKELEDVIAKRRDLMATWLYQVVIVSSIATPPDFMLI
jgi:hypothetical protein